MLCALNEMRKYEFLLFSFKILFTYKIYFYVDDIKLNESKEKTTLNLEVLGELWLTREEDDPKDALFISPEDMENNDIKDDWDYVGARYTY